MQTDGDTPLLIASLNGHVECVRALLGGGAAINQADVSCAKMWHKLDGTNRGGCVYGSLCEPACMRLQLVGCAAIACTGGYGREVMEPMPYFRSCVHIAIMSCSRRVDAVVRPGMRV